MGVQLAFWRKGRTDDEVSRKNTFSVADTVAWWQAWQLYLKAQLRLLDIRAASLTAPADGFAYEDSHAAQEEQVQAELATLTTRQRTVFKTVVARTVRELQHQEQLQTDDPDALERQALTLLWSEAVGEDMDDVGVVYLSDDPEVRPVEVDARLLHQVPSVQHYQALTKQSGLRRYILAAIVGILGLTWAGWWFFGRGATPTTIPAALPAKVNGQVARTWTPSSITLTTTTGTTTMPVLAPGVGPTDSYARWLADSVWPLQVCSSATDLSAIQTIVVGGRADVPNRSYTRAAQGTPPDLVLTVCGGQTQAQPFVLGSLNALRSHPVGEPVTIQGQALSVVGMTLTADNAPVTADQPIQATLTVSVTAPADLDWVPLAPVLRLPSGETLVGEHNAATFQYLLSQPTAPLDVAWEVIHPETGQVVRWRTTLDPPVTRGATVTASVTIADAQAEMATEGLQLRLVVMNTGAKPIQLQRDDIRIQQGNKRIDVPQLPQVATPLQAGEGRTIDITLPGVSPGTMIQVQVGGGVVQIGGA